MSARRPPGSRADPFAFADRYGVDAVRYYLLREFPFGQDGAISESALVERYNADLANTLGNLVNRVRVMLLRYRDGAIPSPSTGASGDELMVEGAGLWERIAPLIGEVKTNLALAQVMQSAQSLNRYVDERRPWVLARDRERSPELDDVLAHLVAGISLVSALLAPAMPRKMAELRDSLSLDEPGLSNVSTWPLVQPEIRIPPDAPVLFAKLET